MQLIDGKATAAKIKEEIAEEVKQIVAAGGKRPHLAAILVGHDGGSETYVKNKVLACEACGFTSTLIRFEDDVKEEELLSKVQQLNEDKDVDGFIVQLPLPKHINEQKVIMAIDYRKDVDGFHPINVGRMAIGLPCFISATPLGIITLLKRYGVETSGKKCVILGRSNILSLEDLEGRVPRSRHHHCRHRQSELRDGRHGEGGRHDYRRGYHPSSRCNPQERIPPEWRREVRRGCPEVLVHHTRAGRRGSDDHLFADEEHAGRWKEGVL